MKKLLMAIVFISIALVSCKDYVENIVAVTGVKLDKTTLTLVAGNEEKLTATVEPEDAEDKTVTYSTSDAAIATVAEDGTVKAVAAGSATITVTTKDGNKTATCQVTVTAARVDVTGVTLNKPSVTLQVAGKETLVATVLPETATEKSISWSSSDDSKVKVSPSGEIEGMAAGTATITVTTLDGNKTATCTVTVQAPPQGDGRAPKTATLTVFAGSDEGGYTEGSGSAARFNAPRGIALDSDGTLYVADMGNHAIRKITPAGAVSTLIGNGDPEWEMAANGPFSVAINNGWLYVGENAGMRIRMVKLGLDHGPDWGAGEVKIFAGDPDIYSADRPASHANGDGTAARFAGIRGMDFDAAGNLYVCDFYNRLLRKITPSGTVSDYAGVLCENCSMGSGNDDDILSYLRDVVYNPADGNLYVAALNRERIVKVTALNTYATFVGSGNETGGSDYKDGIGTQVDFARPAVIASDAQGYMFLGEQGTAMRLRFVTPEGKVSTIAAGEGGTPDADHGALLPKFETSPSGIAVTPNGETLYIALGNKILKIALTY